ncbi:retrovirus-related pol polyprotein from transposon TNT 1-94, partial [Tanacetum coccineum]
MSINHEKYTLVIVDEYSRYTWVHFLKKKSQAPEMIMSFIRMNFSSPYTPKQNGVAERKNRTLIEAARTMLNGSVLSKHFWTEAVRIACKFDAKDNDSYFLGYSFVSKAFRVFNTRIQQVEETYHVIFDESMEAIRFTNTSEDEIGINDSSRYPPNEFLHEDDPSRQYQETDIQEKDKKKAKNKQNRARNGKDKVKSKPKSVKVKKSAGKSTPTKSKVNQMKKIQLEGLKLPNLNLYYKNKRQGLKLHT